MLGACNKVRNALPFQDNLLLRHDALEISKLSFYRLYFTENFMGVISSRTLL